MRIIVFCKFCVPQAKETIPMAARSMTPSNISNGPKSMICGLHTNMCVLGRPFGLRQLSSHRKNVVLLQDLTDTMYNPVRWPYINHFSGTDLILDHVERHICPTIASNQLFVSLNSTVSSQRIPFRFPKDRRPHLAMRIAEDEYQTANTLPQFAATHLRPQLRVSIVYGDSKDRTKYPRNRPPQLCYRVAFSIHRSKPVPTWCAHDLI